ncbi:MAG: polyprenyl synthetase family protein [Candidatus Krumholzibacteriota bacterium]|nr:polyprenyl synthetase family protein [Candidatus Krumholzibacteriota bacterium]
MGSQTDNNDFSSGLKSTAEIVEKRLDMLLPSESELPVSLHKAMRYSTLQGGKRLRAILCIWGHRLAGNSYPEEALDAACAIECLHAYTLIHDDLPSIDDDGLRRGLPSCHIRFGEAIALLAGDALQALAFEILSRGARVPDENRIYAIGILSKAAGSRMLVGGQVADLEGEGKRPTEDMVKFIHRRKTAELISASISVGAALETIEPEMIEEIADIGRKAGLAFQIVDDILDQEGDASVVGKGLRKDDKRGKITWPAAFGMASSRDTARALVDECKSRIRALGDDGDLEKLFEYILERIS